MKECIAASALLPLDNTADVSLINPFTHKLALPAQQHDLLNFTSIGECDFKTYVQHMYLGNSSVKPTARQHRLKTFATIKATKRLVSNLQKEKNFVSKCLKSRLIWAQVHDTSDECPEQQYLELPRAITTENGIPNKGEKSNTTSFYTKRYGENAVLSVFPPGWYPDVVIIEGMFMINTIPLRIHTKMVEYTKHLLVRYSGCYLNMGISEIHIVFDDTGRFGLNPKRIEQARRDARVSSVNHEHVTFTDEMQVPSKWREILECRQCKRKLIVYMGQSLLQVACEFLRGEQKLFTAGTGEEEDQDTVWFTTSSGIEYPAPGYKCAAEEGDTRVWLHADHAPGRKKLIYSPDTDVYHIGLTNIDTTSDDIIVQLSSIGTNLKLLHINEFIEALYEDPDLSSIPTSTRAKTLQILYISTGCDFVSFFVGIGKAAFLKSFFRNTEFITGQTPTSTYGSLSDTTPDSNGVLAFIRLVGVAYFEKNRGAFDDDNPTGFFNSVSDQCITDKHKKWYNEIRAKVWPRIAFEDQLPP